MANGLELKDMLIGYLTIFRKGFILRIVRAQFCYPGGIICCKHGFLPDLELEL